MAILTLKQVEQIIKANPNKQLLTNAVNYASKLQRHVLGWNLKGAINQNNYFESADVFAERSRNPTSNADLYARLLHREEMVFNAKGGASMYTGLDDKQSQELDAKLDKIRFNMSIRKWIKEFALQAYRVDPMGVLFVEVDADGNSYPTYKASSCVFDYQPNGRALEYVFFKLSPADVKQFVPEYIIPTDQPANVTSANFVQMYYRVVDDATDRIIKYDGSAVSEIDVKDIAFKMLPGIIVSDLIDFSNTNNFLSPLNNTVELGDTYFNDRSIRDLSKKYSGFPKGFEPLLACGTCDGSGFLAGKACPACTVDGSDRGTGFKLRTKVADIARFPLPKEGQTGGINDPSKFFGYITPNIDTWNKQDTSLNDIEAALNDTYWGTTNRQSTTGPTTSDKHVFQETATKTLADLQPIYARLNATADWAQSTENALCNFIGELMFADAFKQSVRTYGRYYILETPDELIEQYLDQKTKGSPQSTLFDTLRKYYHSLYANDPTQLAIKLKLVNVEPFVHQTVPQVQAMNPSRLDFFMKTYFSEWLATKEDSYLLVTPAAKLITDLQDYATKKMPLPAEMLVPPAVSISETIRNTN